ncbi:guanylate kinase [Thalassiosira pseudonana CCMP1335]|uniref:guanylate kinase n=1 Tax=Thalassiosira pseudonana TaxID=35128 RepID=B8BUB7_THAPS|nr:guanylate kinase [Thalassiosira pseudonana CCMP1335]EED94731.1 guanylate kinase [Thalassiosira pseudonana CCMP1335]
MSHLSFHSEQYNTVCGPSGVGKGTIINRYMEESTKTSSSLPKFGFTVSHTTRRPRPGEENGVHYNFVTRDFFQEKIGSGDFFIEWAEVHGNMYGTSFQAISDVSKVSPDESEIRNGGFEETHCLLDIDVEGVKTYSNNELPQLQAKFVFIAPPSVDALRERLLGRGTETPATLERRFQNAKAELEYGVVEGNFDAIVVNDDLDRACEEFITIVKSMYGE